MIVKRIAFTAFVAVYFAMAHLLPSQALAGETVSFDAFSVWKASGRMIRTGEHVSTFVGIVRGPIYIETERGPVGAGDMICPIRVEIEIDSARQAASGNCTFTTKEGKLLYSNFTCTGFHLIGCKGNFEFTGGTDEFAGLTGQAKFTVRSDKWELTSEGSSEVKEAATGIAFWRELSITTQ
jgi:hypothetical protein